MIGGLNFTPQGLKRIVKMLGDDASSTSAAGVHGVYAIGPWGLGQTLTSGKVTTLNDCRGSSYGAALGFGSTGVAYDSTNLFMAFTTSVSGYTTGGQYAGYAFNNQCVVLTVVANVPASGAGGDGGTLFEMNDSSAEDRFFALGTTPGGTSFSVGVDNEITNLPSLASTPARACAIWADTTNTEAHVEFMNGTGSATGSGALGSYGGTGTANYLNLNNFSEETNAGDGTALAWDFGFWLFSTFSSGVPSGAQLATFAQFSIANFGAVMY